MNIKFVMFSVLSIIFLGFVISGFSMLFPDFDRPFLLILFGLVGLAIMSWFGYGLLSKR